ncbi:MAG: ABC transporter permease [Candidatus Stahlbacteria bacterium]|nr:ABC transporter permease [candidate division WOR-3 bacterium]TET98061.1 MAG: ABC transporter permease [Candidatus Stahlbacteria bacterium]
MLALKEKFLDVMEYVGSVLILLWQVLLNLRGLYRKFGFFIEQIHSQGVKSISIVIFTSVFMGMVTAYQAYYQGQNYMPDVYIGMAVTKALFIELGPLIVGLVIAGRVASSIAAELGTMKVTEQIDALEALAINPIEHLVVPRVFAGIIVLPILTIIAEFTGIIGGWMLSVYSLNISHAVFWRGVRLDYIPITLYGGLIKSMTFGLTLTLMGCFYGLRAKGGAEGVGEATTKAVISSTILILFLDYVVSRLVFD